jgi:hypothetical protein
MFESQIVKLAVMAFATIGLVAVVILPFLYLSNKNAKEEEAKRQQWLAAKARREEKLRIKQEKEAEELSKWEKENPGQKLVCDFLGEVFIKPSIEACVYSVKENLNRR